MAGLFDLNALPQEDVTGDEESPATAASDSMVSSSSEGGGEHPNERASS